MIWLRDAGASGRLVPSRAQIRQIVLKIVFIAKGPIRSGCLCNYKSLVYWNRQPPFTAGYHRWREDQHTKVHKPIGRLQQQLALRVDGVWPDGIGNRSRTAAIAHSKITGPTLDETCEARLSAGALREKLWEQAEAISCHFSPHRKKGDVRD